MQHENNSGRNYCLFQASVLDLAQYPGSSMLSCFQRKQRCHNHNHGQYHINFNDKIKIRENVALTPKLFTHLTLANKTEMRRKLHHVKIFAFQHFHQNIGASLCASFNWFCAFLVVRFYPNAVEVHTMISIYW